MSVVSGRPRRRFDSSRAVVLRHPILAATAAPATPATASWASRLPDPGSMYESKTQTSWTPRRSAARGARKFLALRPARSTLGSGLAPVPAGTRPGASMAPDRCDHGPQRQEFDVVGLDSDCGGRVPRRFLGSVSDTRFRKSPGPALVVRNRSSDPPLTAAEPVKRLQRVSRLVPVPSALKRCPSIMPAACPPAPRAGPGVEPGGGRCDNEDEGNHECPKEALDEQARSADDEDQDDQEGRSHRSSFRRAPAP